MKSYTIKELHVLAKECKRALSGDDAKYLSNDKSLFNFWVTHFIGWLNELTEQQIKEILES